MKKQLAALSPENLHLIATVARSGSMAAAARELGLVPSSLTYRVRQVEDALDVLVFDRSSRRARLTPAGTELLRAGEHLLRELDAVAQRVRRVATGWEPELTIAADALIARATLFELCEAFYALGAPTRLRLRAETLSGTWEALLNGQADLALGVPTDLAPSGGLSLEAMGSVDFVFAVAPHHPLALAAEPLSTEAIQGQRAVAAADSSQRGRGVTVNLLPGQDVLTVPTMQYKLEAQLRGLGCGWLPLPLARPYLNAGLLVAKTVSQPPRTMNIGYVWRSGSGAPEGRALSWWLEQLRQPRTRLALLENHHH